MYVCGMHEREESTASYSLLTISAYKGMEYSPITLFPNTSNTERRMYSRRRNIPPHRELEACASYSLPESEYQFFHPELMRKWSYMYSEKHDVRGVGVLKLVPNKCRCSLLTNIAQFNTTNFGIYQSFLEITQNWQIGLNGAGGYYTDALLTELTWHCL